jgi:hypothetical protein
MPLDRVPPEVWNDICCYLDIRELISLLFISKKLYKILQNEQLWHALCIKEDIPVDLDHGW